MYVDKQAAYTERRALSTSKATALALSAAATPIPLSKIAQQSERALISNISKSHTPSTMPKSMNRLSPSGKGGRPSSPEYKVSGAVQHSSDRSWTEDERITLARLCRNDARASSAPRGENLAFWQEVSMELPGRTPGGCYVNWRKVRQGKVKLPSLGLRGVDKRERPSRDFNLEPSRRSRLSTKRSSGSKWSPEEHRKLLELCTRQTESGIDWEYIIKQFPHRSVSSVQTKWRAYERLPLKQKTMGGPSKVK